LEITGYNISNIHYKIYRTKYFLQFIMDFLLKQRLTKYARQYTDDEIFLPLRFSLVLPAFLKTKNRVTGLR